MDVKYLNNKVKSYCTKLSNAKKQFGNEVAIGLFEVLNLLKNSDNLMDIKQFKKYKLHPLKKIKGVDRSGQMAITLAKSKYRLIICPLDDVGNKWNGKDDGNIFKKTKIIGILEVTDYHV